MPSDTPYPRPLVLSVQEAAKALGVSDRTLRDMTKAGRVPHVRLGCSKRGRVVYPVVALQEWLLREATSQSTAQEDRHE